VTEATGAELRHRLVLWLQGAGAIRSEAWRRAFDTVPRHRFLPRVTRTLDHWGRETVELDGTDPDQREEWLDAVYRNLALAIPCQEGGRSGSSQPRVMAYMLEALQVEDGDRVLEIGTGSGYQAALLCERLGGQNVISVDIDPVVMEAATAHLHSLGYRPTLALADGACGFMDMAPYDRVIATAYGWPIPRPWIQQTRPGGLVVAIAPSSMVALSVAEDGSATGPLHHQHFGFMALRGHTLWPSDEEVARALAGEGQTRRCRRPPRIVEAGGDQRSFWVLLGMLVLPYDAVQPAGRGVMAWYDVRDGSWLRLDYTRHEVTQGGPRRLWDEVEDLYDLWCDLGAPNRERFGLTVTRDGRHVLWLDSPASEHRWELAP
jgi:protein-L-isoaspartate(D-aspartate) O-methyltransferase